MESNQTMNLNTAAGTKPKVLTVLTKKSESKSNVGHMSSALTLLDGKAPELLPMINPPTVRAQNDLQISVVKAAGNIKPTATYAVLSKIEKLGTGQGQEPYTLVTKLWEVYAQGWVEAVKLPVWPDEQPISGAKRWETVLAGSTEQKIFEMGPGLLENMTHATRAQTDF